MSKIKTKFSSKIRENLNLGNIELANKDLKRIFSISGKVIKGDQRGRTIGILQLTSSTLKIQLSSHMVYML